MFVYVSCTVMHFACSTEYVYSNKTNLTANTKVRKVVEFEQFQNLPLNKVKSRGKQSAEFEFIIGGLSIDGVAKRVHLKINNLAD